jgi:hypothetical protein
MIWDWAICGKAVQSQDEREIRGFYGGKKVACITKLSSKSDAIFLSTHQQPPLILTAHLRLKNP